MDVIRYMDLFGISCKFYIENKPKYWTVYGGILSITSIILFIILFYFLNYDELKRNIPQTTTSSIPESNYRKIKFDQEKIWIPFRIIDYYHKIDFTNFLYPVINYRIYNNEKDDNIFFIDKRIPFSLCSETSMTKLDRNKFIIKIPLNELYCINMNDLYMNESLSSIIKFDLYLCKDGINYDKNNTNCISFEKLSNIIDTNNSLILEFLYPIVHFQPTNFNNPAVVIYKQNFFKLSEWINKKSKIYLKEHVLKDDIGFLYSQPKNLSFWGVSDVINDYYFNFSKKEIFNVESNSKLFSAEIYIDTGIIYSTRTYKKLINLIIYNLPLLSIVYSIFKKITKILKISSINKNITELVFEKLSCKPDKLRAHLQKQLYAKSKKNINILSRFKKAIIADHTNIQKSYNNNTKKNAIFGLKNNILGADKNDNSKDVMIANNKDLINVNINQSFQNDNNKNLNKSVNNNDENSNFDPSKKYYKEKVLFFFRNYILSVILKNINIKKIFSRRFIEVNSFISYIFDVSTYLFLKKEFDILKKTLIQKKILENFQPNGKININKASFIKDMNDYLKGNQRKIEN